jgi:Cu2+-containing amine oxidase
MFGKPAGYALEPAAFAIPYSVPGFPDLQRAQFAQHQFWGFSHVSRPENDPVMPAETRGFLVRTAWLLRSKSGARHD